MESKADILAALRASVAAIERGEARYDDGGASEGAPPRSSESASHGPERVIPEEAAPVRRGAEETSSMCENSGKEGDKSADAAFRRILRWVAVRERSSAYVRDRLVKDEFSLAAVDEALERAIRVRAVDDRRYGDALIRMKLAAGRGLRDAEAEIAALGIEPSSLDAWQEHASLGPDAEIERALALLRRRPPRAKRAREAAFRKLVGQGFSTDIAATAARRWSDGLFASDQPL